MSWFWTFIFLCFTFNIAYSDPKHHRKLPSAAVVGTVYCHSCILQNSPQFHSISGASVAVECKGTASRPDFLQEVKTNSHGEFTLQLPFPVRRYAKKINGCSVKVISSNNAACAIPATAVSSSLHLKSRQHDRHIFSAGFFTFKPQLCDQKQSLPLPGTTFSPTADKTPEASQTGARTRNQPSEFFLPPNPLNPPLLPFPPNPFQPPPSIFPPNPFQPPPSIFPPLFPSPPPSIFPPIFPAPPPPTFPPILPIPPFPFPPIPGLIPSPPPPPPPTFPPILPIPPNPFPPIPGLIPSPPHPPPTSPSFPFPLPLPPFPFQPTPGFPGVPPADDPSRSKPSKP